MMMSDTKLHEHSTPVVLIVAIAAIVLATYLVGVPWIDRAASQMFISIVLVAGIFIFSGNSGIISFGHIGLMAIAAYSTAWQTMRIAAKELHTPGLPDLLLQAQVPMLPATVISAVAAAVVALITGLVILRLSSVACSIATFAFLAIINVIYSNWDSVTGGTYSLIGIPTGLTDWSSGLWAAVAIIIAYCHKVSRAGRMLQAVRSDEIAAMGNGIVIFWVRLVAYVVSAFVVGIAGALYAHFLGSINPATFYLSATFVALTMLVVGGMQSLSGAMIGTVVLSVAIEILNRFEAGLDLGPVAIKLPNGMQEFLMSIAMCVILAWRPQGIMGGRELRLPERLFVRLRRATGPAAPNIAGIPHSVD